MIDGWGIASRTQKEIVWAGWAIKKIATPITEYAVRKYQICKLVLEVKKNVLQRKQ